MAYAKSTTHFSGTLGDTTYYTRAGQYLARRKSSLTGHRVKTDPVFEKSRVRAREFGGAAIIASHITAGLGPLAHMFAAGRSHLLIANTIRAAMRYKPLKNKPAEIHPGMLLQSGKHISLSTSSKTYVPELDTPGITTTRTKTGIQYTISCNPEERRAFSPGKPPQGTTHFAWVLHIQPMSSYEFSKKKKRYEPIQKTKGKAITHRFSWNNIKTGQSEIPNETYTFTLPHTIGEAAPQYLFWWGIIFTQKIGDIHNLFRQGNTLCLCTILSPTITTPIATSVTDANRTHHPDYLHWQQLETFLCINTT